MPSAEDLRSISNKDATAEDFIRNANWAIDHAARMGYTSEVVAVPVNLTLREARLILEKNFPNCQITARWWVNCFKVSWKDRQWGHATTNRWFGWVSRR